MTSLTDITGAIVEQYSYDAFGKPTIKDAYGTILSNPLTPFLFTGREFDSETGLYHYRSRAYSPTIGRFLQSDSIKFGGRDVNLYRYVGNNPVNSKDPDGRWPDWANIASAVAALSMNAQNWIEGNFEELMADMPAEEAEVVQIVEEDPEVILIIIVCF